MIARVFRSLAPALAALVLPALRPAGACGGLAVPAPGAGENGRVVFRHYL